jgi:hypothetical protein
VPGIEYTCVVIAPVPEEPFPKDHAQEVIGPLGLVDAEPLKFTLRGAVPVIGVTDITAFTTPLTRQHVIRAS